MPNKYVTDIVKLITGPLDDLERGGCDLVEISATISRKEITGSIGTTTKREKKEEENEH